MSKVRLFGVAAVVLALVFAAGLSAAAGDLDTTFDGDGKVLTDFASGSSDWAYAVAVQSDGKAVVAGNVFPADNGTGDSFAVARYSVTGGLDPAFDGDGKVNTEFASSSFDYAQSVAIQADGKILVAGSTYINGSATRSDFALVRYNADGSLDGSFDGDGKVTTNLSGIDVGVSVAVQSDGKVVVAGYSRLPGPETYDFAVARYTADGSLDATFDGDGKVVAPISEGSNNYVSRVAVQPDGKIVVGGQSAIGTPVAFRAGLVRYLPDGSLDGSFDGDGKVVVTTPTDSINDLALQPDGKIVAAGGASRLTRFTQTGASTTRSPEMRTIGSIPVRASSSAGWPDRCRRSDRVADERFRGRSVPRKRRA